MSEKLPSYEDFIVDPKNLPSIDDLIIEEKLPSVDDFIEPPRPEEEKSKGPSTVNNALFVGSTSELSKILKSGLNKENK